MADFDLWTAQRWQRGGMPGWVVRGLLPAGWLIAFVLSFVLDDAPCSPADPSVCGPEVGWAVGASLLLATPVLLIAMPVLGCVAGIVGGSVEQLDRVPEARIAFGLHGLACAVVLVRMLAGRRRQAAVAGEAGDRRAVPGPPPRSGPGLYVAAGLLALAATGALLLWWHWSTGDQRHLAAAERWDARIVAEPEDDWTVRLLLPDRSDEVTIDVVGSYEVGDLVPVLVDRTGDRPWVVPVAEQPDPTFPLSAGLALGLVAVAVAGVEVSRRRVPARLAAGAPAVTVLVRHLGDEVELRDTDDAAPFARVPIRWESTPAQPPETVDHDEDQYDEEDEEEEEAWRTASDEYVARFAAAWRGETVPSDADDGQPPPPIRMTAVGDLRQGGWVALVDGTEVLWPLRTVRLLRRTDDEPPEPDDEQDPWRGTPVAPARAELPLVARLDRRTRLIGAVMLLGLVLGPVAAAWFSRDWYETGLGLVVGGGVGLDGLGRLHTGLRLEPDRLVLRHRWRVHEIPWGALHGARRDGHQLRLAWYPDDIADLGPMESSSFGGTPAEVAERVGAAVTALRPPGAPTGPVVLSRWSRLAGAAALVYCAVALVVLLG